jgi:xanthine/uracil permease
VTLIGIVLYIKAAIALVVGIALLVERNNSALLEATGRDGDYILGTAIGEFIAAALLFLVASAIMSGAKWARLFTAIVVGLNIALVSWWMITHFGGGLQWRALITVGLGIFVLWALYGNEESEAYFEGHP